MAIDLTSTNFEAEIVDKKPVLVDFWAAWCGPCRAQVPILNQLDSELVKVCKVNVDENAELAQRFGVSSIPTMIIFKDGKVFKRAVGLHNLNQLKALLEI